MEFTGHGYYDAVWMYHDICIELYRHQKDSAVVYFPRHSYGYLASIIDACNEANGRTIFHMGCENDREGFVTRIFRRND